MNKCIEWEDKTIDYLRYVYNTREVPLSYLIRKDYMGDIADMTREEEILNNESLNGPMFGQYPKEVMQLIKDLNIRTPVEAWIKQVKCGRVDMQKFQGHHDGNSEG